MNKYFAAYKCQLCGATLKYKESTQIPYDTLPELCAQVVKQQQFIGNPYLYTAPMQIPHKCKDGSCGMAYFAGFKVDPLGMTLKEVTP